MVNLLAVSDEYTRRARKVTTICYCKLNETEF